MKNKEELIEEIGRKSQWKLDYEQVKGLINELENLEDDFENYAIEATNDPFIFGGCAKNTQEDMYNKNTSSHYSQTIFGKVGDIEPGAYTSIETPEGKFEEKNTIPDFSMNKTQMVVINKYGNTLTDRPGEDAIEEQDPREDTILIYVPRETQYTITSYKQFVMQRTQLLQQITERLHQKVETGTITEDRIEPIMQMIEDIVDYKSGYNCNYNHIINQLKEKIVGVTQDIER